jgi:Lipopolysaccharide core biosynthesis protein (WaaY).
MKHTLRRRADGFDIYAKNDGVDYWRLAKACIDENIDQAALRRDLAHHATLPLDRNGVEAELYVMAFGNPKRLVLRMDTEGKRYVVKRAFMGSPGFKRLLPGVMGLTYFTRVMKLVSAAVRAGCAVTPDCYLVAERWVSPFRLEVWTVWEYVEGRRLFRPEEFEAHRGELSRTALELMKHGLTMDDVVPGNFLFNESRARAIDISCRPFTRLQKVKMALKLNARYGLGLPVEGVVDRLLAALLSARYRLRGKTE